VGPRSNMSVLLLRDLSPRTNEVNADDVLQKVRLSEFFTFDFNGDNTAQMYNFENESMKSALRSALFSVSSPSSSVILIVRIEVVCSSVAACSRT
jgi:hypothetical protein